MSFRNILKVCTVGQFPKYILWTLYCIIVEYYLMKALIQIRVISNIVNIHGIKCETGILNQHIDINPTFYTMMSSRPGHSNDGHEHQNQIIKSGTRRTQKWVSKKRFSLQSFNLNSNGSFWLHLIDKRFINPLCLLNYYCDIVEIFHSCVVSWCPC